MKQDKTTWLKRVPCPEIDLKKILFQLIIELIKILENEKENIKFVVE